MRIAGIIEESIVDGPGMRYVVFTQGCPHGCPGCHNPGTHDANGGREMSTDDLIAAFRRAADDDPLLGGVTLSGGEPFEQAGELVPFARAVKDAGLNLWVYTGWTIEELAARGRADELELLRLADVLVDGRYDEAQRSLERRFVGSANQRVIEMPGDLV